MNRAWVKDPMPGIAGFDILGLYKGGMKAYSLNSVLPRQAVTKLKIFAQRYHM